MNKKKKVGTLNQTKKGISNGLIRHIKGYQKQLQIQENIKYGRRARHISFVYATSKPTGLAKYILERNSK